ncbi:MAG: YicC/YloC family endoribonuclease [Bacteriovoracia bacterium]
MSAYSMTGFGRGESAGTRWNIAVEIKTVNNRFKDFRFKMGSSLSSLEFDLRGQLEKQFKRGTFDVAVTYQKRPDAQAESNLDPEKVKLWLNSILPLIEGKVPLSVSPTDFYRQDFMKDEEGDKGQELSPLVLEAFGKAVEALKVSRRNEGASLIEKLNEHLSHYEKLLIKNEELKGLYPDMMKDKLVSKLNERMKEFKVDEGRLMQEVIFYLEKLEIDEEINRAKIHVAKLREVMKSSGEVGRQIDFLLQELGRETNTMGSKSAHMEISQNVVEMKVQLEKIREQALNLE